MAERKTIVVPIGTATVQMRPVGFALYAEEFFIAGCSIPEHSRARGNTTFTPVPYYLMCRALELIFKSYLLTKNWTEDQLSKRKYGHNLESLWNVAKNSGLPTLLGEIPSDFESDLVAANAYYNSKNFEYFNFSRWAHGYKDLPPLSRFIGAVRAIVEKTKEHVLDVS